MSGLRFNSISKLAPLDDMYGTHMVIELHLVNIWLIIKRNILLIKSNYLKINQAY